MKFKKYTFRKFENNYVHFFYFYLFNSFICNFKFVMYAIFTLINTLIKLIQKYLI